MIVVRPHFARSAACFGVSDRSMAVTVYGQAAGRKRPSSKGGQALLAKRPIHPLIEAMQSEEIGGSIEGRHGRRRGKEDVDASKIARTLDHASPAQLVVHEPCGR